MITNTQSRYHAVFGHTLYIDGSDNLIMPGSLNQPTRFFIVDPTTMNRNSTGLNLDSGIEFTGDIILPVSSKYLDSAWVANGWNMSMWDRHMSTLIGRNVGLSAAQRHQIKNIIHITGTIAGQNYTIGLIQTGNQGVFTPPGITTGANGALNIGAGQTVSIAGGGVYQYTSINIAATGTLQITGATGGWTEIGCQGNCVINGTIYARSGLEGAATNNAGTFTKTSAFELGSLSYTITQAAGGAGGRGGDGSYTPLKGSATTSSGLSGAAQSAGSGGTGGGGGFGAWDGSDRVSGGAGGLRGNHGRGIVLYVEGTLSGTGSINASGRTGYNGSAGGAGSGSNGNARGGGGGGGAGAGGSGGRIIIRYAALTSLPTLSVSAGAAGTRGNGGTFTGNGGAAGTIGGTGASGTAGTTSTGLIT